MRKQKVAAKLSLALTMLIPFERSIESLRAVLFEGKLAKGSLRQP
jgi:hypothetical protein